MKTFCRNLFALALAAGVSATTASAAATIEWVTIDDPGNAAQSAANRTHSFGFGGDGYGAVDYVYRMGRGTTTDSMTWRAICGNGTLRSSARRAGCAGTPGPIARASCVHRAAPAPTRHSRTAASGSASPPSLNQARCS